jgi:hypothetical protein
MDIAPNTQIYTLPLLFRSLDEVDYVRQRMDADILKYILAQGFVSFGLSEGGFAYLMSNSPLTRTADLKGQKVWAPEGDRISRAAFESLGISPIPLPLSDVLTGLQTGLIDTVATSYTGAIALQWYTQVKYVTEMPLMYIYGTMIIDRNAFEKLDTSDQTVVREVMGGVFKKLNADSLRWMNARCGKPKSTRPCKSWPTRAFSTPSCSRPCADTSPTTAASTVTERRGILPWRQDPNRPPIVACWRVWIARPWPWKTPSLSCCCR